MVGQRLGVDWPLSNVANIASQEVSQPPLQLLGDGSTTFND
jgi:hypothetical protein